MTNGLSHIWPQHKFEVCGKKTGGVDPCIFRNRAGLLKPDLFKL